MKKTLLFLLLIAAATFVLWNNRSEPKTSLAQTPAKSAQVEAVPEVKAAVDTTASTNSRRVSMNYKFHPTISEK